MSVTLKACPPGAVEKQERSYLKALADAVFYSVVSCDELELRGADDTLLVRYAAKDVAEMAVEEKSLPGHRLRFRQL